MKARGVSPKDAGQPVELPIQLGFPIAHLYAGSAPAILAVDATGNIVSFTGNGKELGRGFVDGAADFAPLGSSQATIVENAAATSPAESSGSPEASSDASAAPSSDETPSAETPTPEPSGVTAEIQAIAGALGVDPLVVEAAVPPADESEQVVDLGSLTDQQISAVQKLVDDGKLPDFDVRRGDPQVAVAFKDGVGIMDAQFVTMSYTLPDWVYGPATSIAINPEAEQSSFVAAGNSVVLVNADQAGTGSISLAGNQPLRVMPGKITKVIYDGATRVTQALGRTPDGSGWTVYAIENNGDTVFSDAKLPWEPVAIGADSTPDLTQTDRQALLAFAPDGSMASVDIGQFAFAWRIVGVLFGTLMAVCMYLLARLLFRRRSVGLLLALFTCIDGMLFAQSRIAMNDTYVGGLLLLGYVIFALLWLQDRTSRKAWLAFWLGMPVLGVVMGLALFSKWVALYALASMGVLILIRSALGRLMTIFAMAAGTGTLGWMAIREMQTLPGSDRWGAWGIVMLCAAGALGVASWLAARRARTTPDKVLFVALGILIAVPIALLGMTFYPQSEQNGAPNYTFFLLMLIATSVAAAANAYHPVAWTRQEFWFAVIGPGVAGVLLAAFLGAFRAAGVLTMEWVRIAEIAIAGIVAGPVFGVAFWIAGRWGFGPLALPASPNDPAAHAEPPAPAPNGWLRLGSGFGLPALWTAACLLVLPFVVYIAMYIPWSMPWLQQTPQTTAASGQLVGTGPLPIIMCWHTDPTSGACTDAFPSGHTGQTLMSLTESMYNYHNDLRATHAASSPWWAWPMDLKPVWFESISYGQDTGSMIYDGGTPLLWWLAIVAMAFICWQAFKRRSLGLTLIAVAFLWQWLSWSRIDRASFQYHFYTALPFFLMALAYFLAELWHGPSRRTWLLARIALAGAIVFAPVLWLTKYQLCGLARVATEDYWGKITCGSTSGPFTLDTHVFAIAVVLVSALAWLAIALYRLERNPPEAGDDSWTWVLQLVVPVLIAGGLLIWIGANVPSSPLINVEMPSDGVAIILLAFLGTVAAGALSLRSPRRYVPAVGVAAAIMFMVLYPNLSALPMPGNITSAYNGVLPTWFYGFQFSVNLQPAMQVSPISAETLAMSAAVLFVAFAASATAWIRRVVNGYQRHQLVVAGEGPEAGSRADSSDSSAD